MKIEEPQSAVQVHAPGEPGRVAHDAVIQREHFRPGTIRRSTFWMCVVLAVCVCEIASAQNNRPTARSTDSAARRDVVPACKTDLTSRLRTLDVPGLAAAIVKNGRMICTAVAGMANIEQKQPVTPDTLFLIASVSKTMTATALMQLYDQGKFQLGDDINRYLPFPIRIPVSPTSPITFRQLLTHSASIKDNAAYINCPASYCLVLRFFPSSPEARIHRSPWRILQRDI